ncbi:hypothetical protein HanRHA438_Chr11g0496641 [Helianthus annuus]|uniref:GIR1-like zinc ribbon domain-containing protein n=2 Tax=Helianthus annuus TaxID=4232 RepID=A0A251T9R9_HELAN|nr:hypothetical protein HanXRQr2_Chr11g0483861 [Helianthus annuus]KAJ0501050.1 hypothetical protein HanHA300_Chr11g0396381 [Helianthus annuus]KAJ0516943.1 hypothetical protein HanHA89_Chr11g0419651 [Helianthus annuus]KAJ0684952.1 hypothetical protein HanLR1_Chr11g0397071 [Helianthus annuus]KAJ0688879.1 hypothetical protein HanOQP8_Chr11g0399291 [Helianthus annuus]
MVGSRFQHLININTREKKVFINCKFTSNYYTLLLSNLPYIDTCNGLHYSFPNSQSLRPSSTVSPPYLRRTCLLIIIKETIVTVMVTDVTYLYSVLNQQQSIMNESKSTALITRDLLGGGGGGCDLDSAKELDLDLHVPSGFEKRLDLKSGKVYLQRCKSPNTSSSSSDHKQNSFDQTVSKLQDLNFPPTSKKPLNLFDDTSLDLNLVNVSSSPPAYKSVCTLDKVKSALERAERETIKKRAVSIPKSCSSNSSCSVKETMVIEDDDDDEPSSQAYAAGCPSCLLYVLISRSNPRCPRCNMTVPSPTAMKKPRIDLNISI